VGREKGKMEGGWRYRKGGRRWNKEWEREKEGRGEREDKEGEKRGRNKEDRKEVHSLGEGKTIRTQCLHMPLIVHALGVSQSHIYHQWYLNTAVKPSVATVEVTPISMQAPGGHHGGMGVGERGVWGEGGSGRVTSVQTQDKLGTLYHIKGGLVEGVYM